MSKYAYGASRSSRPRSGGEVATRDSVQLLFSPSRRPPTCFEPAPQKKCATLSNTWAKKLDLSYIATIRNPGVYAIPYSCLAAFPSLDVHERSSHRVFLSCSSCRSKAIGSEAVLTQSVVNQPCGHRDCKWGRAQRSSVLSRASGSALLAHSQLETLPRAIFP